MPLLAHRPERYLRAPRLTRDDDGSVFLSVLAWEGDVERALRFAVGPDAEPSAEPSVLAEGEALITWRPEGLAVSDDVLDELRAHEGGWDVFIEHADGVSTVWARHPDLRHDVRVWAAAGAAGACAVASAADGAWVAFHHDVREDDGRVDVAKWITLRHVSHDGVVSRPAAPMAELNRDMEGVEQSFEYPSLIVDASGAVSLFGRGSHNFWRQDVTADGFGPRVGLSDGEWGSRGRRVAVVRMDDGVLVARRERKGIELTRLPRADGGAPPRMRIEVPDVRPANAAPPSPRDPATRWGRGTYFGDIQQHSAHSDGIGTADEAYLRARYRYHDDFVALTDHESFIGKRTGPGEWEYLMSVADHHDAPGEFATLLAYEWTGRRYPGPGHKCVYLPERGPLISRDDVPEGGELVRLIAERGGFASPHHIGWTGADEPGHDDGGQPVWEICSCHGCYEHLDHPLGQRGELEDQMADEMLRRGHRFGFTASSDSHGLLWHHGEARKRDPYRTGLTAVQAPELTRQAVFEAIENRRCYATSGVKIRLDFRAGNVPMGGERAPGPTRFSVDVVGANTVARIDLVGPEGVLATSEVGALEGSFEAELDAAFVYARIVQEDGEMAWASPIFVSR